MVEKLSNDLIKKRKIDLEENLKIINERVNEAASKALRDPKEIKLLAATKTVPPELINHAISLGVKCVGENKVQELLSKHGEINKDSCKIDFIGHLQTNKVKKIIGKVSMIQSVDSIKLANEIADNSKLNNLITDILIEVNIGKDPNKFGIIPEKLEEFAKIVSSIEGINIKGLMVIPPICINKKDIREYFLQSYKLFVDIKGKKMDNNNMDILSMGMSNDYYQAILEGASMIRIGSALFGNRT